MKTRESGMPDEAMWAGFFAPAAALRRLGLSSGVRDAVDFGCGYGTFAVPAAQLVTGVVHALDIDTAMVEATRRRAEAAGCSNVRTRVRDFIAEGTGLPDGSVGYAMLFNLLHAERPEVLLREAWRVLTPGGLLAVMHWRYDASTPRGPSMAIRPRPGEIVTWARAAGFEGGDETIDLPPYHYGHRFSRARRWRGRQANDLGVR